MQEVNSTKDHAPTVIKYSEDPNKDFQSFHSKKSDYVVRVDRTFNLGAAFVTCFAFTNFRVLKNTIRSYPSFFGTIRFLHRDASFKTYHYFFSHVRAI